MILRYADLFDVLCDLYIDVSQRFVLLDITLLVIGKAIRVRIRWSVLYVPAVAAHARPGPRPYTVPHPGLMVFVPGNALQQPLLVIVERLGNARFRVSRTVLF